jgi:hypothetical protein
MKLLPRPESIASYFYLPLIGNARQITRKMYAAKF